MNRPPLDLSCRELVELVTDYLEARLSVDERTRFEMHLVYCHPCRTYMQQMRQVLAATGKLTEDSVEPAAREHLLQAFHGWKAGRGGGG